MTAIETRALNAPDPVQPTGRYPQAFEVVGAKRLLYVSGQIPVHADGMLPKTFKEQARLAWANVEAQLRAAGMSLDNLVKVTIFLSDRAYNLENREVRRAVLGDRPVALTVIITRNLDPGLLLEIEAGAAGLISLPHPRTIPSILSWPGLSRPSAIILLRSVRTAGSSGQARG